MEHNEINMLEIIHRHDYISQREISTEVGISLGMVNLLLKKFIKIGIIKAERLTGNKVRYILTPEGISFLSKKTIEYVIKSYKTVKKIQVDMFKVLNQNFETNEVVFLYGSKDEIGFILLDVLKKHGYSYQWIDFPNSSIKFIQWHDPKDEGIFLLN